jgi:hypothetical protein
MTTENIYFNSNIVNANETYKRAEFNQIFDSPLLQAPASDYLFTVSRFEISRNTAPIFIANKNYVITMKYQAQTITKNVVLTNFGEFPNSPQTKYSADPLFENYVYNIDQFLNAVNYWFKICFNDLVAAAGTIVSTLPPEIHFDYSTNLFYLLIPKTYIDVVNDNYQIKLFMSNSIYNYFEGLPSLLVNRDVSTNTNYELIYYSTTVNNFPIPSDPAGTKIQLFQSSSSIPYWCDFVKLIFKTNMATLSEFTTFNGVSNLNIEQVLIDYDIVINNLDEYRQPITFSSDLFRFYNFNTNNSVNEWNFKLVLRNRDGQEIPYILFRGDFLTMKFLFQKQLY